jgi:hypothetical protein
MGDETLEAEAMELDQDDGVEIDDEILTSGGHTNLVIETAPSLSIHQMPTDDTHLNELLHNEEKEMTYGRLVARSLSKFRWYNPHIADFRERIDAGAGVEVIDVIPPSLDSAWAYFEHYTLPRHLLLQKSPTLASGRSNLRRWTEPEKDKDVLIRAKYGERDVPTKLYDVINTPESEFSDFGVGIGIYFWSLRWLAVIMLVAGFSK